MRSFMCLECGAMRRAHRGSNPRCHVCAGAMVELSAEQAQAAHRLHASKRVAWYNAGAKIRRGNGKKRWVAVF